MDFNFTVRGDKITPDEEYLFTEGNKGSYEAVFDFGEEWDELTKLCIVRSGDKKYSIPIFGKSCLLPELTKNSMKIGVVGVDALNEGLVTRISTNMLGIGVQSGAYDEETAQELDTAAEVWEQYLTEMEECRKAAEAAKEGAEAAYGDAASAKGEALDYVIAAHSDAKAAEKSAADAKISADNASVSEENAETAEKEAQKAAAMAQTSESISEASADKARIYAETAKEYSDTAKEAAKEAVQTYGIGVRTPEGGTVLGDLENNNAPAPFTTATGNGCIAGMRGYYYSSVEFGEAIDEENYGPCVITLSDKQWEAPAKAFEIGYSVGDVISMINNSKFPDCGTITAINKNVITVDRLPFKAIVDMIEKTGSVASDDYSVFVAKKPLAGNVPLGYGAFASGEDAIALERASAAFGRLTKALGQYGFAANRETIAAYCAAAFGHGAQALGLQSFAINKNTKAKGQNTFAAGHRTVASGEGQAVFGRRNIEDLAGEFVFIIGNGTSDTNLRNAFTVDWDGNVNASGEVFSKGSRLISEDDAYSALGSLIATYTAKELVAGITAEVGVKLMYDEDIDTFTVTVGETTVIEKTPIAERARIASELLKAEKTRFTFYNGDNVVYTAKPRNTMPGRGLLLIVE